MRDWIGVLVHSHTRLVNLSGANDILQNWQDGQLPTRVLVDFLRKVDKKRGSVVLVDTELVGHSHPFYHPERFPEEDSRIIREKRKTLYLSAKLPLTIETLSKNIFARAEIIRRLVGETPELRGKIYTGVEVDIISPNGEVNISQEACQQLDYVGVSYHADEYRDTQGKDPTLIEIINAYTELAKNRVIDVINHPFREVSVQAREKFTSLVLKRKELLPQQERIEKQGTEEEKNNWN